MSRKHNWNRIVDTVFEILPPTDKETGAMRRQRNTIAAGCVIEMAVIQPSAKEMADIIGATHVQIPVLNGYWSSMPWEDRYAWLRLVEGRITREAHTLDAALL